MTDYDPLFDPATDVPAVYSLDIEIAATRRILGETKALNIHSGDDMLHAAVALNIRLRALLAAIEAGQ